jgi:hypothetical protein
VTKGNDGGGGGDGSKTHVHIGVVLKLLLIAITLSGDSLTDFLIELHSYAATEQFFVSIIRSCHHYWYRLSRFT